MRLKPSTFIHLQFVRYFSSGTGTSLVMIDRYALLILIIWTVFLVVSLGWNVAQIRSITRKIAGEQVRLA